MSDGASTPATAVDLRPLTTSELIDRGFSLYRAHFAGFLLLALLAQTAPLLSQISITMGKLNPSVNEAMDDPGGASKKLALILAISLVSQTLVFAFNVAVTFFIADAYLGKIPSVTGSLRKLSQLLLSSTWTCVLARICLGLSCLFPAAVLGLTAFYLRNYPPLTSLAMLMIGLVAGTLFLASLAPVLIVFMRLWVVVPPLALEGLAGWKAIRRSSALVRYDPGLGIFYWGEMRLSFLLLPLFIIGLLLSITSLPLVLYQIGEAFQNGSNSRMMTPPESVVIISQIMTFLAGSLIWPLYPIATTLFYYDVRIRSEGFDLEFMAHRLKDHA